MQRKESIFSDLYDSTTFKMNPAHVDVDSDGDSDRH